MPPRRRQISANAASVSKYASAIRPQRLIDFWQRAGIKGDVDDRRIDRDDPSAARGERCRHNTSADSADRLLHDGIRRTCQGPHHVGAADHTHELALAHDRHSFYVMDQKVCQLRHPGVLPCGDHRPPRDRAQPDISISCACARSTQPPRRLEASFCEAFGPGEEEANITWLAARVIDDPDSDA